MAVVTEQMMNDDLVRFKNRDAGLTMDFLKLLQRVGKQARSGGTTTAYLQNCAAAKGKLRTGQEALDREWAALIARRKAAATADLVGAALPEGTAERLLFEQLKANARPVLEPLFVAGNAWAVVKHFEDVRDLGDLLGARAVYAVAQELDRQHPDCFGTAGSPSIDSLTSPDTARIGEATIAARAALGLIEAADADWQGFIRRRGGQTDWALATNARDVDLDLVHAFTDYSLTPYERVLRGDTAPGESLLLRAGI